MRRVLGWLVLASCAPAEESSPPCTDVFYADGDGDAFGDPGKTATACAPPDGYVAVAEDCDDARYATRPGADEICNDRDDDCDGAVDEDAIDPSVWFLDEDADGYGTDDVTTVACAPEGYALAGGDCDETNPAIHPGATEVCDELDNDCDHLPDTDDPGLEGGQTWFVDGDYDGYGNALATIASCGGQPLGGVADSTDCNDEAAAAHPSATEICDLLDNDCDGLVDALDPSVVGLSKFWPDPDGDGFGHGSVQYECFAPPGYADNEGDCSEGDAAIGGAGYYYEDVDGDGYGGARMATSCAAPAGFVSVTGDCDDAQATAFPGAVEVCDAIDDDCDGLVDADDPGIVYSTWYGDGDDDGYGDDTDTMVTCAPASGYVAVGGDCDDDEPTAYPDAYELCDAIDNDCTGTADDAIDYVDWYADVDGDGYGDSGDSVNDCSQPSGYVLLDGDCDDETSDTFPDAVETCPNGVDDDCDAVVDNCPVPLDDANLIVEGIDANGFLATAMAAADVDGDGTGDLVLGAPGGGGIEGAVFVVGGPTSGTPDLATVLRYTTSSMSDSFGYGIAGGDSNGDGSADLIVGAPSGNSAYVFLGPVTADRDAATADLALVGAGLDATGTDVAIVSDVDGDGGQDFVVGAPRGGTFWEGLVYVVSGASSGTVDVAAEATYEYAGGGSYDSLGYVTIDLGDTNGDGIDELAFGASLAGAGGTAGVVYVVDGGASAGSYDVGVAASTQINGSASASFGFDLSSADYDNDGTMDLFVGAPTATNASGVTSGAVFAYMGPLSGVLASSTAVARWESTIGGGTLGYAVAADGDVDGDKTPDLLMGAPTTPISGSTAVGCAYLQLGLVTGTIDVADLRSFPASSNALAGRNVAFVSDWDGDDGSEVAIGAPYADGSAGTDVGSAYVLLSGAFAP